MSANFYTPIPVDLAAIKKLLPPDAYVDPVLRWNKDANRVEVHWSSSLMKSPYSFAHEFTVDMLLGRELPEHVTAVEPPTPILKPEFKQQESQVSVDSTEYKEQMTKLEAQDLESAQPLIGNANEKPIDVKAIPRVKRGRNERAS